MTGAPARIRDAPAFIALLHAIAVAGCGPRLDPATTLTVAVDSGPASLDPRLGSDEASRRVFDLLYSGLFRVGDDARPVPDLASSYRTEDSRTVVVTLRPGVLFHDGSPCAARDVVYTYRSILTDEVPSFRKGDLSMLDSIEAPDDRTVVFRLKQPFAPILTDLNVPILKAGAGPGAGREPVGTGPFRLTRYRKDEDLLLARFDRYFLGPGGVRTIHLKIVPSETARLLELLKGSVDLIVNDLSPDQFARVARTPGFIVQERPGRNTVYMAFNLSDPILSDRRVRQAIALSLDRAAMVAHLLHGAATLATGLLPPGHWAYTADVPSYDFDPAAAADLLQRAGYRVPGGSGPRTRLSLTCKVSTSELAQELAAVIQEQLGRIGIGLAIRAYEWPTFYEDLKAGRFQIAISNWTEISDPDIYRLRFHSRHVPPMGFNRGRYDNAEVDRLIDAGAAALDEGERARIYRELQRILAQDLPYVNLWHRAVAAARRDRVRGFRLTSGADFYPLREVTLGPKGGERGSDPTGSAQPAAEDALDGGNGDGPRADETGRLDRQIDHGGGRSATRRSPVQDQGDLLAESGRHLPCRGRSGLAGAVGTRGDDGARHLPREAGRDRMGGNADPDRVPAAQKEGRKIVRCGQHESQRTRPECRGKSPGDFRKFAYGDPHRRLVRSDERQRHPFGAALGLKDPLHGSGIARIRREAVEGLRRIGNELPGLKQSRRPTQESRIGTIGIDPLYPPHAPGSSKGSSS